MSSARPAKWIFVVTGVYALACVPAILVAEKLRLPEWPLHTSQLLAVIVCFLAGALFLVTKRSPARGALGWLAIVACVLCGLWLAFIAFVLFWPAIADITHRQAFDAKTWREEESTKHDVLWPPRLCMIDDLMASRRLIGMTLDQVIDLLGPPADKSFPYGAVDCDIHYYLGPERGFLRVDSEWLFLKFERDNLLAPDDKVVRQWIYRD